MLDRIPIKLYHKSNPLNRKSILLNGLIPTIGDSYAAHYDEDVELIPMIFLYDNDIAKYDTTWDDDIYEINTKFINKNKLVKDPDEYMYHKHGCYGYIGIIPKYAIKLVYKGTGKSL